jgi:LSD1 subclass zinc finger protein
MAYSSSGNMPIERASKIGHLKIINEPRIQRLLEEFERVDSTQDMLLGEVSGTIDLSKTNEIRNIVAIDGSHAIIPNEIYRHKRIAFVTAGAIVLRRSDLLEMKENPIIDPRDLTQRIQNSTHSIASALPLSGIAIPGETLVKTIRNLIHETLHYTKLYDTLQFLVSREWDSGYVMNEHMNCTKCREIIQLPKSIKNFKCNACGESHTLSDYLQITDSQPEDWAREETVSSLRNILETLMLFQFVISYRDRPVLRHTLFVKDGPLLLRAHLSRLVEPIRAFIENLRISGRTPYLVGVEKSGALVDHIPAVQQTLKNPGDFFLPSVQYLHERIEGVSFDPRTYRNRVHYGSKIVIRLGHSHVVAFNLPTGEFKIEPSVSDLIGFEDSMAVLSEMVSFSYENAIIPLVLANSATSISMNPSSEILEDFVRRIMGGMSA